MLHYFCWNLKELGGFPYLVFVNPAGIIAKNHYLNVKTTLSVDVLVRCHVINRKENHDLQRSFLLRNKI